MTCSRLESSARTCRYSGRRRARFTGRVLALVAALATADAAAAEPDADAAAHLAFESLPDGRCQVLSEGGKLRVLRNTHAERAIAFRLVRVFAGNHPQGLSTGTAPPGGAPIKLGCTRVDGRSQDWQLVRARYVTQE